MTIIALNDGKTTPVQADIDENGVINKNDYSLVERLWRSASYSADASCKGFSCAREVCNDIDDSTLEPKAISSLHSKTSTQFDPGKGYIIELWGEPIALKEKELTKRAKKNEEANNRLPRIVRPIHRLFATMPKDVPKKLVEYKQELKVEKNQVKKDIKRALGKDIVPLTGNAVADVRAVAVRNEYDTVFNGFVVYANDTDVDKIKKLRTVKKVHPNLKVNITLMDSVPWIGANQVWQLDANGNNCETSGEPCLTGAGIKIGIIDTGVDYTHPDLNDCYLNNNNNCNIIAPYSPAFPAINGTKLVWHDNRYGNYDIFMYDISSGIETQLTYSLADELYPRIHNDMIVWHAMEYSANQENYLPGLFPRIYLYNISNGQKRRVISLNSMQMFPSVYNNIIVWMDARNITISGGVSNGVWNIHMYNISNGQEKQLTSSVDTGSGNPEIYGDKVIWKESRSAGSDLIISNIFMLDLSTGEKQQITFATDDSYVLHSYKIYGDTIIWFRAGRRYPILMYNINTRETSQITTGAYFIREAAIFKNNIFWSESRNNNLDIFKYDIFTGQTSQIINDPNNQYDLALSDDIIVLKDNRSVPTFGKEQLYSYRLSNGELKQITGFDITPLNSDLYAFPNSKVIGGYDFVNNDNDPMDDHGHGTHVAATAAGNGLLKGIAPDAKIVAYKVLSASGSGYFEDIIAAIERSVDPNNDGNLSDHLDVISLSLGGTCSVYSTICGPDDSASRSIDRAVEAGVIAVVAAGNSGPWLSTVGTPGTARRAITVGAVNKSGELASFSSRGPIDKSNYSVIKPDVVAPGVRICAAQSSRDRISYSSYTSSGRDISCLDRDHITISGTSMATPHVSGAVALLKQAHPDWSPDEIKMHVRNTAQDILYNPYEQGYGLINLTTLLSAAYHPTIAQIQSVDINREQGIMVIRGTALSNYSFHSYSLSYGEGLRPSNWTQIYQSSNQVNNDTLFIWNFGNLSKEYLLKLEVRGTNRLPSADRILFNGFRTLINFGVLYDDILQLTLYHKSLAVGDINNDGNKEIIAAPFIFTWSDLLEAQVSGSLYALDLQGRTITGFPQDITLFDFDQILSSPTLADINNDGYNDIILTHEKTIHAFDNQGRSIVGFPFNAWNCEGPTCYQFRNYLPYLYETSIGNIDADSIPEIFTVDIGIFINLSSSPNSAYIGNLFAVDQNGIKPNFPMPLNILSLSPTSLADLDGDENQDIIFAATESECSVNNLISCSGYGQSRGVVKVLNAYGLPLEGWPRYVEKDIVNPPVIGDIDGDRKPEIIIATDDTQRQSNYLMYPPSWSHPLAANIYAFNHDGSPVVGFPVASIHPNTVSIKLALGDMDADSYPEIIALARNYDNATSIISYYIYVIKGNGAIILSKKLWNSSWNLDQQITSFPIVGDVNGDGSLEIVVIVNSEVHVINKYGNELSGWPMLVPNAFGNHLVDLNKDRKMELLVHTSTGKIIQYTFEGLSRESELDWPMYQHDNNHTGRHILGSLPCKIGQSIGDVDDDGLITNYDANLTLKVGVGLIPKPYKKWRDIIIRRY
ncbi:S8 family serine peptidase [Candidatus Woesearchaeota archaeon]|nr:S8 family serine peptidase [Candidatus Woesearchaeota archaeon]